LTKIKVLQLYVFEIKEFELVKNLLQTKIKVSFGVTNI